MKNNTESLSSIIINAGLILEFNNDWRIYLRKSCVNLSSKDISTLCALLYMSDKEFDRFIGVFIGERV